MITATHVLELLPSLARERPVFHSEADFQHALAWQIRKARPDLRIRLETRPAPRVHLDLLVTDSADGQALAIELKYLTALWDGEVDGESFTLFNQGAQDIRGYDCVKDIARVEVALAEGYADQGLVLILANHPGYWRAPVHGRSTNAAAFRLYEGTVLAGSRAWGPNTGAGTMAQNRKEPIPLAGRYRLAWQDYSQLPGQRGTFRYLAVPVARCETGPPPFQPP